MVDADRPGASLPTSAASASSKSPVPLGGWAGPQLMIKTAKGITDAEIEQAAAYFSG